MDLITYALFIPSALFRKFSRTEQYFFGGVLLSSSFNNGTLFQLAHLRANKKLSLRNEFQLYEHDCDYN